MDEAEWSALVVAVADGDRGAFALLYQRAGPLLFAISLKVMRRRDQAEEVLQDAFVRIWRKAHLFDAAREARPWLATIVRRCAFDRLRAERAAPLTVEIDELDALSQMAAEPAPGAGVGRDLTRCLGQLSDGAKRAIVLAYVHGLTHDEIAGRLETPLGTIKSWIRRGLGQMKACLEQ